jgi:hypothetical protein
LKKNYPGTNPLPARLPRNLLALRPLVKLNYLMRVSKHV